MSAPQIIVTRAENEQAETLEHLNSLGFDALPCPLSCPFFNSEIRFLRSYQAVLVTSRNAVRALSRCQVQRDVLVIAVGEGTQGLAHALGFKRVLIGDGTVASMRQLVVERCDPQKGPLLYARGEIVRHDLGRMLAVDGFEVDVSVVYGMRLSESFPPGALQAIQEQKVWGALFSSQWVAHHFYELILKGELQKSLETVYLFSLSSVIDLSLQGLGRASFVAEKPTFDSLYQLLKMVQQRV